MGDCSEKLEASKTKKRGKKKKTPPRKKDYLWPGFPWLVVNG
jgi:hypothetical protein